MADAYDNALMECVIGLYKTECVHTTVLHSGPDETIGDAEYATAGWVDWYNNRRLHSLGMMTPVEYEQAHYATLRPKTWGASVIAVPARDKADRMGISLFSCLVALGHFATCEARIALR